jgi:hypothetical protein
MLDDKVVPISGWRVASDSYRFAILNGLWMENLVERIYPFLHIPIFAKTVNGNRFTWNICPILLGLKIENSGKFLKLITLVGCCGKLHL